MTETAEPRDKAQDTVAMTAATMGHDIVATLLNELRKMPGHWPTLNAEYQQRTVEEFKQKISEMVRKSIGFMLTSEFAAVPAKLENLNRGKSIKASLTVSNTAMFRHALFDAQGSNVLVVIADPAQWLTRMDDIKARGNQLDLFEHDANYDPERDQPGYRRDRDPLAPGASWEELKKTLGVTPPGTETKPADPAPTTGEKAGEDDRPKDQPTDDVRRQETYDAAFLRIYGKANVDLTPEERTSAAVLQASEQATEEALKLVPFEAGSLTPEQEHAASLREMVERLAAIGVPVSVGELQSRGDADILAASLWLNWYESAGIGTPFLDRPAWIPEPPKTETKQKGKKK